MSERDRYQAIGTVAIGVACLAYVFWRKKKKAKTAPQAQPEAVKMETKITIDIPLPSEDVYNTETVKKVFQSAAVYYGEKKFLHFAGALQTIIESIEDTIRARSITEDQMEKDIASLMSPVIFMLDNKFHKKEHPSNVDILAFEEEILPQITKRRPGFLKDYEIFKTMMTVNDKPVPAPVIAEPVHVNGFAAVRPQMVQ